MKRIGGAGNGDGHGNGHATMSDVAQRAGVSLKSVSRVVNNEAHVSPRLRLKVEEAIAELDYVPDPAARSLAGSRNFEIGLILGEMGPSYNAKVVSGVYRACVEARHHLRLDTISHYLGEGDALAVVEEILRNSRCDGFVIVPPYCDMQQMLDLLDSRNIRYSLIGPAEDLGRAPGVAMDDTAAAREVAELFLRHGHRRIALVNGLRSHAAALRRREGFLTRLRELDPGIAVIEAEGEFLFDRGIEAGLELLRRPDRPSAIFALNDDSAAGVMAACNQLDLAVPGDVSICGFDDSWVAKSVWPHLTTVHQPSEEMAYIAARKLLQRLPEGDDKRIERLDFTLVERGSVGPAP